MQIQCVSVMLLWLCPQRVLQRRTALLPGVSVTGPRSHFRLSRMQVPFPQLHRGRFLTLRVASVVSMED